MKKKGILAGLGLACTFFAMVLFLSFYAKTDHARNLLLNKINSAIPGTILAENIAFSFVKSTAILSEIQIKDGQGTTCFKANSLFVDVRMRSLLKKVLEINLFLVNGPEILLVMDQSGRINIVDALVSPDEKSPEEKIAKTETQGLPINVVVKKAQVIEGALTFSDSNHHIELRSLNVDITDADLAEQRLSLTTRLKNSIVRVKDKQVRIENFDLVSGLEHGSAIDFNVELDSDLCVFKAEGMAADLFKTPRIDLTMSARSFLEKLNSFSGMDMGGLATLTLNAKGILNNPDVTVFLDVANLKMNEDLTADGVNLSAILDDRILSIKKADLNILGSDISFTGMADLKSFFPQGFLNPAQNPDTLKYEFSFDQKRGDFQHLEKWITGISGRFSSTGKIAGRGIGPESLAADYHINLVLDDVKQDRPETDFMDVETDIMGTIEQGICKITRFHTRTGDAAIEASGRYDMGNKNLAAELKVTVPEVYEITRPLGIPPVRGRVDGNISVAGHINTPEIKAMVSGKNLGVQDISVSDLKFSGSLLPSGRVAIQQLMVKDQDMTLDVKGSASVFEKQFTLKDRINARIQVSGDNINPGRFLEPTEIKMDKRLLDSLIHTDLNLVVDVGIDPAGDKIKGRTNLHDSQIPVKNIKADLDLGKSRIDIMIEKTMHLDALLNAENNQYQAWIKFDHSDLSPFLKSAGINGINVQIDGQIDAAGNMPVDLPENMIKGLDSVQGRIVLNADVKGSFKDPDFMVSADFFGLDYTIDPISTTISNLNGRILAAPDSININGLTAKVNDGRFSLTGNIGLKAYQVQDCKLAVRAERIAFPISSASGTKQGIVMETGESDLEIYVQYDETGFEREDPPAEHRIPITLIKADVRLNPLDISALLDKTTELKASFDPETSGYDLNLSFNQTQLSPLFKIAGIDGMHATVNGSVKSKGTVNLDLPLDAVDAFKQATGQLTGLVNVNGTLEKPEFDAELILSGLGYPIPQAGISISNLNGKIRVQDDVVQIQHVTADLDRGNLSMDGKIDLKGGVPLNADIAFKANRVALELPDTAMVEFSHDLNFSGTPEKSKLSGTFKMIKGKYYKDFTVDLADVLTEKKRKPSTQENKSPQDIPWLENMHLNIDVDHTEPFAVDNNIAFILLEPDVNISGMVLNPIVTGRARVLEGTVTYLKKEFEIEKGVIDFADPYKIDPHIDVAAKTKIRKWTITLKISGKTDNLKFQFFSEPAEAQEDILSLIISGKTTKELGAGGGSGSYTRILTDKASDIIGKGVEESTPLDSFKVGYDGAEGSNVSVTVGKKLSKRLEVLYSMETEDEETVHTRSVEYKILENILLKAFNDSNGMFGTELTFKLEFR